MGAPLWIGLGSAIGGAGRFGLSSLFLGWLGPAFPWGTLVVNVTGCFVIGFFNMLTNPGGRFLVSARARQFFMIGVCGGYTTFSAFSFETVALLRRGAAGAALAYLLGSVVLCLLAVWLGHVMAARIGRLTM